MKKLAVSGAFLLIPFFVQAQGLSDISWMAVDAAKLELQLEAQASVEVLSQGFAPAEAPATLATKTVLEVQSQQNQQWTCVSQFAKTPEFFKVIKTECQK